VNRVWSRLRLAAVVLLAANAGALFAYTLPRHAAALAAERRLAELRQGVRVEGQRLAQRRERASAQAENAADLERLRRALAPRPTALVPTLEALERMAREAGLRPRRRSYSESEVSEAGLVRVVVELPLDGRYASLVDFLGRVEAAPQALSVDSVALRRDEGQARLQVRVSAWFAPGEAQ
jgi:Tfp pilus assembly protein PilO